MRMVLAKGRFKSKWVLVGAVALVALAAVPRLWSSADAQMMGMGGPPPVSVARAIEKPVTEWRDFSGILQAVNAVEIRPRVSGAITGIHFTDGAEVKKGQLLFTIDPRPYVAESRRARGALASAQAAQAQAQQDFARAEQLIQSQAISQSEFESRQSALRQANGALESAAGAYSSAQVNVEYSHITAPISGKISRAEITLGNMVDGGPSAPLMASIVDLSPIYASFDVDEQTFLSTIQGVGAAKLKNIPVEVRLGNGQGKPVEGRIHSFDNQLTPGSGTIRVRAVLDNPDGTLVPGLYARVRMGGAEQKEAVLINPTAVGTDQDKKFVIVIGADTKGEYRTVTLGGMSEGMQIITSGLKPGEMIVVNGLQRVRPGSPVAGTEVDMMSLKPLNPPADAAAKPAAATTDAPPPPPPPAEVKE